MMRQRIKLYITISLFLGKNIIAQEYIPVAQLHAGKHNMFGAVPYEKGWVYVTDENRLSWASYHDQEGKPMFRLVVTDSAFGHTKNFPAPLSERVNNGPVAFYNNDQKAVVTMNMGSSNGEKARLGLYFFTRSNSKWQESGAFEYNHTTYSCGHATINNSGDTLVFASDMPGGLGGTDLYMSTMARGKWTTPVNLKNMNSSGNEMFPFLHSGGRLFFTSDRTGGRGGLDIYASEGRFPHQKATILDSAINSRADDFAYWCYPDQRRGIFASNRNGYDQLYTFSQWVPEFADCQPWQKTILCYAFYEESSLDIKDMPLVYEWDFGDGNKVKNLSAEHCYEQPGVYTVQLNVLDTLINKLYLNEATYELEITEAVQPDIQQQNQGDSIVVFTAGQGTWTGYDIKKMYWKVNGTVKEGISCSIDLKSEPVNEVYLLVVSAGNQNTACFTRKVEIKDPPTDKVQEMVAEEKQEENGREEKQEEEIYRLVLNESVSRTKIDREHFKEFYTRVDEFYFPEDSVYRYTYGEATHPLALKPYFDQVHQAGFDQAHVRQIPDHIESTSGYTVSRTSLTDLEESRLDSLLGSTFELPLVYFDYNKASIKEECRAPLDQLAGYLLKHPGYTLEITAHTDSDGPDQFNLTLSEKRAASVFAYLAEKGIEPVRMTKSGHGESHPKYDNTTKENKARNRRVEFRILK